MRTYIKKIYVLVCWHRPIFPGSRPPSIFGTVELNDRVRHGNGWDLNVINTNYGDSWGNRTPDAAVRGRSLNRLTNEPKANYTLKTEQRDEN